MDQRPVAVREEHPFARWAERHWSEEVKAGFIDHIARHPMAGVIIPGTGGVRKIRWFGSGRGKRGGARIIYYFYNTTLPVFLLTAYAKSEKANLDAVGKAAMRKFVEAIKRDFKKSGGV
jgi:hypothetical protein